MKIRLADYIANHLVEQGIIQCFSVTGGGAMHLNDAFGHHAGIHCIYQHHEQGCAMAAEGYARAGDKMALVCVTSGPGGTNAITGVLGAWLDSIPMVVLSGQVKYQTTIASTDLPLRQLGDQEYDIISSVKSMTKYAVMVTDPLSIAYHLEKALFLANTGRRGPVWLDIPLNVQSAVIETDDLAHYDERYDAMCQNPVYDEKATGFILEKMAAAKRPVIFAGEGVRMSGALADFLKLIETLGVPVVTAWNAHDLVPESMACCCGRPGTFGTRGGNFVVQNSDFLLVLGCRLNIRQISYSWELFAPKAYKVMVDIDAAELFKPTLSIDYPVHANVRDCIQSLLSADLSSFHCPPDWLLWASEINDRYNPYHPCGNDDPHPINPYTFLEKLSLHWAPGETIVAGNGSACVITFQAVHIREGQRLFANSGCATMGYAIPAAIGAAVATGKRIICLDGDGSIMMNLQELQTVVTNQLDIRIILLNNQGYHSIRQTQTNLFHPPLVGIGPESKDLGFPNFSKIAQAFGLPYYAINRVNEIDPVLDTVWQQKGPCICEAFLDPGQFFEPKLLSRVLPDGTFESPELDDMHPFLDREEYMKNKLC